MPRYDFRCRACGGTFEVSRPMERSGEPATCPQGHDDTVRLLSTVAVSGGASTPPPSGGGGPAQAGGAACCGGGCCGG